MTAAPPPNPSGLQDLVVWTGPVALWQVPGATVPGAVEYNRPCTGDGSSPPKCADVAYQWGYGGGSMLPGLAQAAGLSMDAVGDVFLGAFSAGGALYRRLLENPTDRRRVKALLLADATYASWADQRNRIPAVHQALVDFGVELAGSSDQLWVATASPSPNYNLPTGVEVLREYRKRIEEQTGRQFERLGDFFGVDPQPDAAYRLGNVVFAEYPMKPLGHGHTKIADQIWQRILWPWLIAQRQGRPEPPAPGQPWRSPVGPPWLDVVSMLAGAVAGYLAVKLVMR
jgi:hypothetical protein